MAFLSLVFVSSAAQPMCSKRKMWEQFHNLRTQFRRAVRGENWCQSRAYLCSLLPLQHEQLHMATLLQDKVARQNLRYDNKCVIQIDNEQ